jgi:hypothetical protein
MLNLIVPLDFNTLEEYAREKRRDLSSWVEPERADLIYEKWFLHSFFTTAPQQADMAGNILLFFYKKKRK